MKSLWTYEPTLVIGALVTGINAAQVAAIPMPTWAHAVALGVTGFLGALVNRSQVSPSSV